METTLPHPAHHAQDTPKPTGLLATLGHYITTTNHKDIGTMYLWFAFFNFIAGGIMALLIRAELFVPGLQVVNPSFYNQLITLHGLVMIFGALMPAFTGFANWQIPVMIGAPDMAFARINNWSFWLLPPAALLLLLSFFVPGGATAAGWTLYAPLSTQMGLGMDMAIFAIHLMGISSIMGAINIITTIFNMRSPDMPADAHAAVLLDLADYRGAVGAGHAGVGRRGDHAFDRPSFRNQLFQCRRRGAIRFYTSTSFGSSAILKSISWLCRPSASSPR